MPWLGHQVVSPPLAALTAAAAEILTSWGWGHEDNSPADDAALFSALEACYVAHGLSGYDDYAAQDLASWLVADAEEAYWDLLPRVECFCGEAYRVAPYPAHGGRAMLCHETTGACSTSTQRCRCGRLLADVGQPEQLTLL